MKFEISKEFAFSAAHHLQYVPDDHPCHRVHGHNYAVKIVLRGRLDGRGFVFDYHDLEPFKQFLDNVVDHRDLNATLDFEPTAELLAAYFLSWCHKHNWPVAKVGVSETPKTWAWAEGWE